MLSSHKYRLSEAFEFTDGLRQFAVTRGEGSGLEPDRAAALLRARLRADRSLRRGLAVWVRARGLGPALADEERLLAALLRDIAYGQVRVLDLGRRELPAYSHTFARGDERGPESNPTAPEQLEPGLDEPTKLHAVEYLALGDINFSTDRAVMLPGPSSEGEREGDLADGIALIAGLLAHLNSCDEERRVIAAGHTDAAGSFAHNLELSQLRARSVELACNGDADGFADHAAAHGEVADAQEVLRWIALRFGWGCDPGFVDNDDGPKTSAARAVFRDRYNAEFGESAGSSDEFEHADWLAFFRMYEQDLAARLGVTRGGLVPLRERLAWADPVTLACGEHWPEAKVNRSPVNRADRRVELLCFAPEHLPAGAGSPPGASVYGDPTYRWTALRPGPGPHPLDGPCFELSLPADLFDANSDNWLVRLRGGLYDLRHLGSDARRRRDALTFHFHGVAKGIPYSATIEHDGEPIVLFEDARLDSYIDGIDDLEHQPSPLFIHVARPSEPRTSGGHYSFFEPSEED